MDKLIISCDNDEAVTMAILDRNFLDYLPTDQKYTKLIEDALLDEYGYGFLSKDEEQKYVDIPDYINDEDIILWEAEKVLYDSNFTFSYPEAKEYVFKKH